MCVYDCVVVLCKSLLLLVVVVVVVSDIHIILPVLVYVRDFFGLVTVRGMM